VRIWTLALEFQTDEAIAPEVAGRYLEAGIPLIAIDIPHPGATYFGANNYQAGLLAGSYLGRWARSQWNGARIGRSAAAGTRYRAGTLVHGRMSGVLAGLKETVPGFAGQSASRRSTATANSRCRSNASASTCGNRRPKYVLVGAANDPSALGAARRLPGSRPRHCAQSSGRTPSPMRASSCARPHYAARRLDRLLPRALWQGLIRLALDILAREGSSRPRSSYAIRIVTARTSIICIRNDELLGVKVLV
jgi:ribose transport system substrate-binding protein